MKFIVDEEGKKVLDGLCDLALKTGGLQNKPLVDSIQANTEDSPKDES